MTQGAVPPQIFHGGGSDEVAIDGPEMQGGGKPGGIERGIVCEATLRQQSGEAVRGLGVRGGGVQRARQIEGGPFPVTYGLAQRRKLNAEPGVRRGTPHLGLEQAAGARDVSCIDRGTNAGS
jgi:hypothetical protein